jgi:glycosyltransferase involved in cell wall biosynthesis
VTPLRLIKNLIAARLAKAGICHITGDIQYIASVLPPSRTVLTIHDVEILKRLKGFKKLMIRFFWFTIPSWRLKYITTISEFSKAEIIKFGKIPAHKLVVIPNCVDIKISALPFLNEAKPVIFHIGTKENKNLIRLSQALKGLNVKLLILGKLSSSQKMALQHSEIDYESHFDLSFDEVLKMYQRCTFFAFVSTYEGFGLPILEAQSLGRAVLSSNVASIPEVACDSALLVDPFDVNDIRRGVIELLDNKQLRDELVVKGFENVKKYSPSQVAKMYFDLYSKIASK